MKPRLFIVSLLVAGLAAATARGAAEGLNATNTASWLSQPLSLADALNIALKQNAAILKAKNDVEAASGVAVQTRAIAIPKVRSTASYTANDPNLVEQFPIPGASFSLPTESWAGNIHLIQSLFEGGRIVAALRSATLTREQAWLNYQTVLLDALTDVRVGYDDVLLTADLIAVREASLALLTRQLQDTTARFKAGTVPRFNVLRAEVELANAKPPWIRARNAYRIAKQNFTNLLGYNVPRDVLENLPLRLTDKPSAEPFKLTLPDAIGKALTQRTELAALEKAKRLRAEAIKSARAGYLPSVQAFGGYDAINAPFSADVGRGLSGWSAGLQMSWDIFDGGLTRGKVREAEALYRKSIVELDDTGRRVELDVRTAWSNLIEAWEVLESQKKVREEAEEALRLAEGRYQAGAGTQLDVLSAQTALTESRSTFVQALRDYSVARTRMERAIGLPIATSQPKP